MIHAGRLGVLGGTFDPIHVGHLDAADAARRALALDEVRFIPSSDPPHKTANPPAASAFDRFALVSLAISQHEAFRVSDAELRRSGPTYTIDTLHQLHGQGWTPSQLFFIIGADAFAEIATWRGFPAVLDAASFAVIARPGLTAADAVARLPDVAARVRAVEARDTPRRDTTGIYIINAVTRDVSSTTIRARLSASQPIDDLVPMSVAHHIVAHHLYGAVDHLHGQNTRNNRDDQASS